MAATIAYNDTLEVHCCTSCGMRFGVPADWINMKRRTGHNFCCPNGHNNGFIVGETDADKFRKEVARLNARLDQEKAATAEEHKMRVAAQRSIIAHKATNTKLKKKLATGQCPCCEKLFPDLAGHMATEHPDFEGREDAAEPETK